MIKKNGLKEFEKLFYLINNNNINLVFLNLKIFYKK